MPVIQNFNELRSFCRRCGGDRNHTVEVRKTVRSGIEEYPHVEATDLWDVIQCKGCDEVSFRHVNWLSEDIEVAEDGSPNLNVCTELYPPAPHRKMPEWKISIFLDVPFRDYWMFDLHQDIYKALGLGAFGLAVMGVRTIVEQIITDLDGNDSGSFQSKLDRLENSGRITESQNKIVFAAFDAGSASAHRGYKPTEADAFSLLDIAESLIGQFLIGPILEAKHKAAAADLSARTPKRACHKAKAEK